VRSWETSAASVNELMKVRRIYLVFYYDLTS
jgi:hypothetical protein